MLNRDHGLKKFIIFISDYLSDFISKIIIRIQIFLQSTLPQLWKSKIGGAMFEIDQFLIGLHLWKQTNLSNFTILMMVECVSMQCNFYLITLRCLINGQGGLNFLSITWKTDRFSEMNKWACLFIRHPYLSTYLFWYIIFFFSFLAPFSGIKIHFELQRIVTNHWLQTFIPSMMLCMASAASVFIPPDVVPGRMGICITSFLSLISLFNGAR